MKQIKNYFLKSVASTQCQINFKVLYINTLFYITKALIPLLPAFVFFYYYGLKSILFSPDELASVPLTQQEFTSRDHSIFLGLWRRCGIVAAFFAFDLRGRRFESWADPHNITYQPYVS